MLCVCVRVNVHAARIRERHSYLAKDIKRRRWTLSTQLEVANIVFATHCLAATAICSLPAASSTSPDLTLSLICLYESWQSAVTLERAPAHPESASSSSVSSGCCCCSFSSSSSSSGCSSMVVVVVAAASAAAVDKTGCGTLNVCTVAVGVVVDTVVAAGSTSSTSSVTTGNFIFESEEEWCRATITGLDAATTSTCSPGCSIVTTSSSFWAKEKRRKRRTSPSWI